MAVASSEGDDYRYSCNLKIWIEHKYTVQIQIRLLPLIRVCTISYSAALNKVPLNKHKRKYGDDSILFEHTLRIHIILLQLIRVCTIFYSIFFFKLTLQENLICILVCASYVELSQKIFSGNCYKTDPHGQSEQFSLKSRKEINISAKIINPCQFITDQVILQNTNGVPF